MSFISLRLYKIAGIQSSIDCAELHQDGLRASTEPTHPDAPHPVALLPPRRDRPRRRTAKQPDDLPAPHAKPS